MPPPGLTDIKTVMQPNDRGVMVNPCTPAHNTNLLRYVKAEIVVIQHANHPIDAQRVIEIILKASPNGKTGWFTPVKRDQKLKEEGGIWAEKAYTVSLLNHGAPPPAINLLAVNLRSKYDVPDGKIFTEVMNEVRRGGFIPGNPNNTLFNHFSHEEIRCKSILNGEDTGENLFIPSVSDGQIEEVKKELDTLCKCMGANNQLRNCYVQRDKAMMAARAIAYFLERVADAHQGNEDAFTEKVKMGGTDKVQSISIKGHQKSVRRHPDGALFLVDDKGDKMMEMLPYCTAGDTLSQSNRSGGPYEQPK